MTIGLAADIFTKGRLDLDAVIALRDRGLVSCVELEVPRLLGPLPAQQREHLRLAAERLAMPVSLHSETTTFAARESDVVRRRLLETMTDTIHLAEELGARMITVHPPLGRTSRESGSRHAPWTAEQQELLAGAAATDTEVIEAFREFIGAAAPIAREAGVILALENMRSRERGGPLNSVTGAARFVKETDLAELGLCLDVRKACWEGAAPEAIIRSHASVLTDVHAAGVTVQGHPAAIDQGNIDWPGVVRALRDVGYDGPVVYEGPADKAEESLKALWELRAERLPAEGGEVT